MAEPKSYSLAEMLEIARREHLIDHYRMRKGRVTIRYEGLDLVLSDEEAEAVLDKMLHYLWRSAQRRKER